MTRPITIMLLAVGALLTINGIAAPQSTMRYASPTGAGDGQTRDEPYRIANFLATAQPGWTLALLPGKYTGAENMIAPPAGRHGSPTAPITVMAEVDGGAWLDAESLHKPVELLGNNWWVIAGLNLSNAAFTDHICNIKNSHDVTVRRCCGWDAGSGDTNIFRSQQSLRTKFIDCAAWGTSRKLFSTAQGGDDALFLRCWGQWTRSTQIGPKEVYALAYNSYRARAINCISSWNNDLPQTYVPQDRGKPGSQPLTNHEVQAPQGGFSNDGFENDDKKTGIRVLGCIGYVRNGQRFTNSSRTWTAPFSFTGQDITVENCASFMDTEHSRYFSGFFENPGITGLNFVKNCSFIGGPAGSRPHAENQWTVSGTFAADAVASGRSITSAHPKWGAQITHRYDENGTLTGETLWPWPMNDRISVARIDSGYAPVDVTAEIFGLGGSTVPLPPFSPSIGNIEQIAVLGRQYLAATPGSAERKAMEASLREQTTQIGEIIARVRPNAYVEQPKGRINNNDFTDPAKIAKYPSHQWHMFVPQHYKPSKPFGAIIWLHGGATWAESESDQILTWDLDDETVTGRSLLRTYVDNSNYITIAPQAPFWMQGSFNLKTHGNRWTVPGADQYLLAIITEVEKKYNIDRNKIAVCGFSMGGIGAAHMAQRLNDVLCAAVPFSFHWKAANWRKLNGLPLYPIHGDQDQAIPVGFADVMADFAGEGDSPLVYTRFKGGHNYHDDAEAFIKTWINGQSGILTHLVRDPYRKMVHARDKHRSYITAENYQYTWDENHSPHTYWISINESKPGTIAYDQAIQNGNTIMRGTVNLPGASVDASITDGTITVKTANVKSLSVWISPQMFDGAATVTIIVDGVSHTVEVKPNLLDALRSYERRWDWNMSYWQEVVIPLP